jgi:voltage-gated potassium channel Kch
MVKQNGLKNKKTGLSSKRRDKPPIIEKVAQWLADYRLPLAAALLLASIVLGYIGHVKYFSATGESNTVWDDLYYTLRMVNPAATPLQGTLNIELQVARVLAAIATLYIAAEALLAIFRDQVQMLRLRAIKNHIVICGLGQKGLLLTDSYRALGANVVIIERNENNPFIGHCRDRGAIVLTGNASDPQLLRRAKVDKARHVISVCDSDGTNTEIALYVRQIVGGRKGNALSCLAHIVDLRLWSFLREREIRMGRIDTFRLSFFNIYDSGTRILLYKYRPFVSTGEQESNQHIIVIGVGRMGERLVVTAARMWKYSKANGHRLRITLIDKNANCKKESMCLAYPELEKVCELLPVEMDVNSPEFERAPLLGDMNGWHDATKIYICLGDESIALATALKLQKQLKVPSIPMIVRMNTAAGLTTLLRHLKDDNNSTGEVHAFPLLDEACTPGLIWGGSTYEILARAIHDDYIRNAMSRGETPVTNRSMVPWEDLPEALRESNRNQAEHISEKLHTLGYDFVMTSDWDPQIIKFSNDEIEQMARMEHTRFVNERLRAGWKYGTPKDDEKKISPTLILYNQLSEEEKDKDRTTVTGIPEFLSKAGFQVYRTK